MMPYYPEPFSFLDISELIFLTLVWGIPFLQKCVWMHNSSGAQYGKSWKNEKNRNSEQ